MKAALQPPFAETAKAVAKPRSVDRRLQKNLTIFYGLLGLFYLAFATYGFVEHRRGGWLHVVLGAMWLSMATMRIVAPDFFRGRRVR